MDGTTDVLMDIRGRSVRRAGAAEAGAAASSRPSTRLTWAVLPGLLTFLSLFGLVIGGWSDPIERWELLVLGILGALFIVTYFDYRAHARITVTPTRVCRLGPLRRTLVVYRSEVAQAVLVRLGRPQSREETADGRTAWPSARTNLFLLASDSRVLLRLRASDAPPSPWWPSDLERLAELLDVPLDRYDEPMAPQDVSIVYPGLLPWRERQPDRFVGLLVGGLVVGIVAGAALMTVLSQR